MIVPFKEIRVGGHFAIKGDVYFKRDELGARVGCNYVEIAPLKPVDTSLPPIPWQQKYIVERPW